MDKYDLRKQIEELLAGMAEPALPPPPAPVEPIFTPGITEPGNTTRYMTLQEINPLIGNLADQVTKRLAAHKREMDDRQVATENELTWLRHEVTRLREDFALQAILLQNLVQWQQDLLAGIDLDQQPAPQADRKPKQARRIWKGLRIIG